MRPTLASPDSNTFRPQNLPQACIPWDEGDKAKLPTSLTNVRAHAAKAALFRAKIHRDPPP